MTARSAPPATCPACATPVESRTALRHYRAAYNDTEFSLWHCRRCGLMFWTPHKIDPGFYEKAGFAAYESYHRGERPFPQWTLPFFRRLPARQGRLLDIGCGDGAFLARAKTAGFDPYGIDLDAHSVSAAREVRGLRKVYTYTLDQLAGDPDFAGKRFDIVTFFEVLEHQDDLRGFLARVRNLVKPGGHVAGSVPNRDRFLAWLDRRVDSGDLPPHHFFWFSRRVLSFLLAQAGFESIHVEPSGNVGLSVLHRKLVDLVAARMARASSPRSPVTVILGLLAWPPAAFLWLGYRLFPAHLYFQARLPDETTGHG